MKKNKYFMEQALIEAEKAYNLKEVPIGAVIEYQGKIIGRGYNRRETDNDPTAHAEIIAIRTAAQKLGDWRLEGCSIYVTVEPCLMCAGAILKARIKTLIYGASSPKDGALKTLCEVFSNDRLNHQVEFEGNFMTKECSVLMQKFFEELRSGRMGESG